MNSNSLTGSLKFLFNDSVVYGVAAALSRMLSIITFPVIAGNFSVGDYGCLDLFSSIATFLGLIVIFAQDSALARFFFDDEDHTYRKSLVSQSLFIVVVWMIMFLLSAYYSHKLILESFNIDYLGDKSMLILLFQTPFFVLMSFCQNILKWARQRKQYLVLTYGYTVTYVITITIILLSRKVDIDQYLIIGLIHFIFFTFLGIYMVRNLLQWPTSFSLIPKLLKYAGPLGLVSVIGALVPVVERSLAIDAVGIDGLGYLSAGLRIASIISLFIFAFQMAWGPFWLSLHKRIDAIDTYNSVLRYYSFFIVILVFSISLVSYPVFFFLTPIRFASGITSVLPLLLGFAVQSVAWILSIGISISKKTHLELYIQLIFLLLTVVFLKTIGQFGVLGLAYSFLLSRLFQALLLWKMGNYCLNLKWDYKRPLLFIGMALIFGGLCSLVLDFGGGFYFTLICGFSTIILFPIGYFFVLNTSERLSLGNIIMKTRVSISRFLLKK